MRIILPLHFLLLPFLSFIHELCLIRFPLVVEEYVFPLILVFFFKSRTNDSTNKALFVRRSVGWVSIAVTLELDSETRLDTRQPKSRSGRQGQ